MPVVPPPRGISGVTDLRNPFGGLQAELEALEVRVKTLEEKLKILEESKVEGFGEVTWPGGTNASNAIEFAGLSPGTGHYFLQPIFIGRIWFVGVLTPTATSFRAQGYCPTELVAVGVKEAFRYVYYKK